MLAAGGGRQQLEAQRILRILYDSPSLGIGHLHFHRGGAQRMKPLHTVKQLGNAGAEAFHIGKQPAR